MRTTTLAAWFCFLLYSAVGNWASAGETNSNGFLGRWSSGTLDASGAYSPGCTAYASTTRTVTLSSMPGSNTVAGEWVRSTSTFWIDSNSQKCRWNQDEKLYEPNFFSVWTYRINGVYDSRHEALSVHGEYSNCLGNACEVRKIGSKSFDTELKFDSGRLINTNKTADPTDDVEFLRISDEADEVDEARSALDPCLKSLDAGNSDAFYDCAASSSFRESTPKPVFKARVSDWASTFGLVTARRSLIATHFVYAPMISKAKGDYVLLNNLTGTDKNVGGGEFIFMIKEGGTWKVLWITYGS
jgi:hypothetical protein